MAEAVEQLGLRPRRPGQGEPNYDLAWEQDGTVVVAEVKSVTEQNEERQMRLALGQVVRYRHQLGADGKAVQAMIAVERRPSDATWLDLCNEQGVILAWPEVFAVALQGLTDAT